MSNQDKKRAKFIELGQKRVVSAIKAIRLIGNLSNKSNYSYSQKDADKIIRALEDELKLLKRRFQSDSRGSEIDFQF